jgi:prophage maintenance system killer protein
MQKGEIEIYKTKNGTEIQVILDNETIWLDAHLIATLFNVNRPAIVKHIRNIYKAGELEEKSTCSILEQVAADGKKRKMHLYNLDVIISVGYRVNSKQATQFRQWATQRLKDFLVQGYAINQRRLKELEQVVNIIQQSGKSKELSSSEAKGLLDIIAGYTQSFVLLNRFDSNKLTSEQLDENITYEIEYTEAIKAILTLKQKLIGKKEATALFGNQKDESFQGILGSIVQTFGGEYLYKSIEEQAAHLLYFTIKNHPFSDGNKRIGAFYLYGFLKKTNTGSNKTESSK